MNVLLFMDLTLNGAIFSEVVLGAAGGVSVWTCMRFLICCFQGLKSA